MFDPLVSVIIPAYNVEKVIVDALDSVYAQTYRPIEVIVIDDGSTDNTSEIINNYKESICKAGGDIDLIYICQENSGPSRARNTGINAAKGEYIAFLDADDLWAGDKLDKQMQLFKREQRIDVIFCNVETTKSKNGKVDSFVMFERNKLNKDFFGHDYIVLNPFEKLLKTNFMLTPAVIAKKTCFKNGFFFNEKRRHAEDWELWLKMSLYYKFGYINDVCVYVKDDDDGLCSETEEMIKSSIDVIEKFIGENMSQIVSCVSKEALSAYLKEIYKWAGYSLMVKGNSAQARILLKKSMREVFDFKTLVYFLRSFIY